MSALMFEYYYVKIAKQSNDSSCCFSKNTKFILYNLYTIYIREIINLIKKECKYVFLLQNYEIFLYEIKI